MCVFESITVPLFALCWHFIVMSLTGKGLVLLMVKLASMTVLNAVVFHEKSLIVTLFIMDCVFVAISFDFCSFSLMMLVH